MAVSDPNQNRYEFGEFTLNSLDRVLTRNGDRVPLTPKVVDLLLLLVEHNGSVVEKERLMKEVWPDTFVEEGNLTQNISVLRKALGDNADGRQYIQTIPKRGYRFTGLIRVVPANSEELIVAEHSRSTIVIDETVPARAVTPVRGWFSSTQRTLLAVGGVLSVLMVVGAVLVSLRKPNSSSPPAPRVKSIAVLPFKPLSTEGREEYLELGIADALITRLSSIKQIRVRPTSSIRKFAGTNYDPILAGRELKTDAVIDGSVQRLGDRLRINVQLIRISDGSVLWGYHCDDLCTDLFTAQDSISENVAHSLALTLSDIEGQTLTKRYTSSSEALRNYLNARYYYGKRTKDAAKKTVEYLEKAVALDPQYALAYAALSEAYASMSFLQVANADDAMPKAKLAAEKALKLDPQLAESHSAAGFIKLSYDWDWDGAEREFQMALQLNPNESVVHDEYATLLEAVGRTSEAIAEMEKARELDPLSLLISRNTGRAYYYARQYDEAIRIWEETAEKDNTFPAVNNWLVMAYEANAKYKESVDRDLKQQAIAGMSVESLHSLRQSYDAGGWAAYWQRTFELRRSTLNDSVADPYELTQLYRRLGHAEEAFKWLNKACDQRSMWLIWLKVDPAVDGLRSDPRFAQLLKRVGLPS